MGLFSNLMGNEGTHHNEHARSIKPLAAGQGGITYEADLVDTLKDDHQQLLEVFGAIRRASSEGRFAHLAELLAQFKLALLEHVALENVKFYAYMQNHSAVDAATQGFIAGVRKEMNGIARTVGRFVDTHLGELPSYATLTSFTEELHQIGDVLAQRIHLEETQLYSLYRP